MRKKLKKKIQFFLSKMLNFCDFSDRLTIDRHQMINLTNCYDVCFEHNNYHNISKKSIQTTVKTC